MVACLLFSPLVVVVLMYDILLDIVVVAFVVVVDE